MIDKDFNRSGTKVGALADKNWNFIEFQFG
jgi:hypothetical protein